MKIERLGLRNFPHLNLATCSKKYKIKPKKYRFFARFLMADNIIMYYISRCSESSDRHCQLIVIDSLDFGSYVSNE